jgi:hypothetical protein
MLTGDWCYQLSTPHPTEGEAAPQQTSDLQPDNEPGTNPQIDERARPAMPIANGTQLKYFISQLFKLDFTLSFIYLMSL